MTPYLFNVCMCYLIGFVTVAAGVLAIVIFDKMNGIGKSKNRNRIFLAGIKSK